jgi:dGTPase
MEANPQLDTPAPMQWEDLLCQDRLGAKKQYELKPHRPPSQYDYDRITFSSAFRRLQDKTQVFPLSSSDYVRTRLTHSMEVATVARSLGSLVGFGLQERKLLGETNPLQVGMTTSAAALAHDIGNPPFGHSGEDSIQAWFAEAPVFQRARDAGELTPHQVSDFLKYEGNAQGFRIISNLQMYREKGGMQLTMATLGAFTKYPVQSPPPAGIPPRSHAGKSTAKFGIFQAEIEQFSAVAKATGLIPRTGDNNCWCRHPLAFIVEAADDICYRIVDLEDAFRQKLISYAQIEEVLVDFLGPQGMDRAKQETDLDARVDVLRSLVVRDSIEAVIDAFWTHHEAMLTGTFDKELLSCTKVAPTFDAIKGLQREHVYKNSRVLMVETAGFKVIAGLLDAFVNAAEDVFLQQSSETHKAAQMNRKLVDLIPGQFVGENRKLAADAYTRMLRIVDYVCGMTDTYALELYRNISGISLP